MDQSELCDRAEITDLLVRYSRAVDTRNWDALDEIFTPDAVVDYSGMGGISGTVTEIKKYLAETMPIFSVTQHMLGLPALDISGDRARAVTPCHNPMVMGTGPEARVMVCALWYHEDLVRTAGGWRISALSEERCHMSFLPGPPSAPQP